MHPTIEKQAFDFILTDIQMPEMDGLEVTRAIREKERLTGGRLPIVAMMFSTWSSLQDAIPFPELSARLSEPRPKEAVAC